MNYLIKLKLFVSLSQLHQASRFVLRKFAFFILILAVSTSFAQTDQTEVEIFQEAVGYEKKVAVANFMQLGDNAEAFWNIYDEYEMERKKLGKDRIKIISDYAESYPDISDEEILTLFDRTSSLKKSFAKMQKTYFNRMKKDVGVSQAAQFWQMENYFNAMVQAEIYSRIPFIGDNLEGN